MSDQLTGPATPECDAIMRNRDQAQAIGEFLEWLDARGVILCDVRKPLRDDAYMPIHQTHDELLHEYFGIDCEAAEEERRALLDHLRKEPTP